MCRVQNLQEDAGFQKAVMTSHGRRPPTTMGTRFGAKNTGLQQVYCGSGCEDGGDGGSGGVVVYSSGGGGSDDVGGDGGGGIGVVLVMVMVVLVQCWWLW